MALEKYGVENRKELLEEELAQTQKKLEDKTASDREFLIRREKDLREAIGSLNDQSRTDPS
jgi:hypothetical protein